MNSYKVVDVSGFTTAQQIENEINNELNSFYYLNSILTIGNSTYLVFGTASVNRVS